MPRNPSDSGIQRALWLSRDQLLAQSARPALAHGHALPRRLPPGRRLPLDAVATLSLETASLIDDVVNL